MKREILFRGQSIITNDWEYGDLIEFNGKTQIVKHYQSEKDWKLERHSVKPETVGQFTGLTDKNGAKIFEGDIIKIPIVSDVNRIVEFNNGGFIIRNLNGRLITYHIDEFMCLDYKVVGNIHDNPEMI